MVLAQWELQLPGLQRGREPHPILGEMFSLESLGAAPTYSGYAWGIPFGSITLQIQIVHKKTAVHCHGWFRDHLGYLSITRQHWFETISVKSSWGLKTMEIHGNSTCFNHRFSREKPYEFPWKTARHLATETFRSPIRPALRVSPSCKDTSPENRSNGWWFGTFVAKYSNI